MRTFCYYSAATISEIRLKKMGKFFLGFGVFVGPYASFFTLWQEFPSFHSSLQTYLPSAFLFCHFPSLTFCHFGATTDNNKLQNNFFIKKKKTDFRLSYECPNELFSCSHSICYNIIMKKIFENRKRRGKSLLVLV